MSITQQTATMSEQDSLVRMGRQDFTSVVTRLVGMELYKLRRRVMSKVLGIITILAVVGVLLLITALTLILLHSSNGQDAARTTADLLHLPLSLYIAEQISLTLGQVLIVILVGVMVGGEYGVGTIRLLFVRGPSRTQFLLAKIGAAIVIIVGAVIGVALLTVVLGQLLNLTTGIAASFSFFTLIWLGHALLYLLIAMLGLFVYAMIALLLATLGRSTAAGIAGVLVWIFLVEPVLGLICNAFASFTNGAVANFFRAIPDYFIGNNVSALQQNQAPALFPGTFVELSAQTNPRPLPDLHALLVLAGYLVLFIGLSWWVNERRDITN